MCVCGCECEVPSNFLFSLPLVSQFSLVTQNPHPLQKGDRMRRRCMSLMCCTFSLLLLIHSLLTNTARFIDKIETSSFPRVFSPLFTELLLHVMCLFSVDVSLSLSLSFSSLSSSLISHVCCVLRHPHMEGRMRFVFTLR